MWDARSVLLESGISTELLIVSGGCHVDDVRNHLISAQKKILGKFLSRYYGISSSENPDKYFRAPRPVRDIKLKYRQGGMSTIDAAIRLHMGRFSSGGDACFVTGHADSSTRNVYGYYRRFETLLRARIAKERGNLDWLTVPLSGRHMEGTQAGTKTHLDWKMFIERVVNDDGENEDVWESGMGAGVEANLADFASFSGRHVHATEVGRKRATGADPWEVFLENTQQCIPDEPGTSISLEGTAEVASGFMYETWYKAIDGDNDFEPFFFPFFTDEDCRLDLTAIERERIHKGEGHLIQPIGATTAERADDAKELERIREAISNYKPWGINNLRNRENPHRFRKRLLFLIEMRESALKWRQLIGLKKCQGRKMAFRRQYPSTADEAFTITGNTIFNEALISSKVEQLTIVARERAAMPEPPQYPISFDTLSSEDEEFDEFGQKNITIWHPPKPRTEYWISVDPSRGQPDGDPGHMTVLDATNHIKVADWHGWRSPGRQASDAAWLGRYFVTDADSDGDGNLVGGRESELIIESTGGIGRQVIDWLIDSGYAALYIHLTQRGSSAQFGFDMTQPHKKRGATALQMWLSTLQIDDVKDWKEFLTFGQERNGRLMGMNNSPDDRVATWIMLAFKAAEYGMIDVADSEFTEDLGLPIVSAIPDLPNQPVQQTEPDWKSRARRHKRSVGKTDWRFGHLTRRERERVMNG
jgi:hypothetical protein